MQADDIEPNDEEKQEKLDEDYDTPFSPPQDMPSKLPRDYPTKDTDMDETEWYQNGGDAASSTDLPARSPKNKTPKGFTREQ